MPVLVADCPRCGTSRIAFDLLKHTPVLLPGSHMGCEAFCRCPMCQRSTTFVLRAKGHADQAWFDKVGSVDTAVNEIARIGGYVSLKDRAAEEPPEHVPAPVAHAFREGATCVSVGCHNAACCMFRLCIDLATKQLLPTEKLEGLSDKTRRDLGLRLPWLFDNKKLPGDLQGLSVCVKDYGNDGAHEGVATEEDARDMLDFTALLLERLYTEPKRIEIATRRRKERRKAK